MQIDFVRRVGAADVVTRVKRRVHLLGTRRQGPCDVCWTVDSKFLTNNEKKESKSKIE